MFGIGMLQARPERSVTLSLLWKRYNKVALKQHLESIRVCLPTEPPDAPCRMLAQG